MERLVASTDDVANRREQLESGCSINRSEYSVNNSKLTRELRRLTGPVKSKKLVLQTMPGLVREGSRSRKELFKSEKKKAQLTVENSVVLALGTELSELMITTVFLVGSSRGKGSYG